MRNGQFIYRVMSMYLIVRYFDICSGQNTKYYLDEYPSKDRKTIDLRYNAFDSSIVLKGSSSKHPKEGQYSFSVLVPNEMFDTYRIYGTTQSFDIRDGDQLLVIRTTGSSNDTIYNSRSTSNSPRSFNTDSLYNKALIFELKLSGSKKFKGFEIILTAERACSVSRKNKELLCSNGFCIQDSLKCNGRNNCGDNSDESNTLCHKNKLIGFVVGGVLLFIAAVAGCVAFCRRLNGRPTFITTSTTVIPSTGNIYPAVSQVPPTTYLYNTNPVNYPGPNPYYNPAMQQQQIPPPMYQNGSDKQPLYAGYVQGQPRY